MHWRTIPVLEEQLVEQGKVSVGQGRSEDNFPAWDRSGAGRQPLLMHVPLTRSPRTAVEMDLN